VLGSDEKQGTSLGYMSSTRMFSVVLQASNFAAVLGKNERFRGNFGEDHDHHLLIFLAKKVSIMYTR